MRLFTQDEHPTPPRAVLAAPRRRLYPLLLRHKDRPGPKHAGPWSSRPPADRLPCPSVSPRSIQTRPRRPTSSSLTASPSAPGGRSPSATSSPSGMPLAHPSPSTPTPSQRPRRQSKNDRQAGRRTRRRRRPNPPAVSRHRGARPRGPYMGRGRRAVPHFGQQHVWTGASRLSFVPSLQLLDDGVGSSGLGGRKTELHHLAPSPGWSIEASRTAGLENGCPTRFSMARCNGGFRTRA